MTRASGVLVLGMGRSGTSAVTRMFVRSGFFAGRENDLLPANEGNPTGHWEHTNVWLANEQVLHRLDASWFDPPMASLQRASLDWAEPLLKAELDRIDREASGAPIVLKDPRIGVMMPLWEPIVRGRLHPILVVRHPLEVALSLYRRDAMPIACGLAAWELHMTALLDYVTGRLVTVAPYTRLVYESPLASSVVEAATSHLAPARTSGLNPIHAGSAFESRFHRNRVSQITQRHRLSRPQTELWRFLSSLQPGDQVIAAPEQLLVASGDACETVRHHTERIRHKQ